MKLYLLFCFNWKDDDKFTVLHPKKYWTFTVLLDEVVVDSWNEWKQRKSEIIWIFIRNCVPDCGIYLLLYTLMLNLLHLNIFSENHLSNFLNVIYFIFLSIPLRDLDKGFSRGAISTPRKFHCPGFWSLIWTLLSWIMWSTEVWLIPFRGYPW